MRIDQPIKAPVQSQNQRASRKLCRRQGYTLPSLHTHAMLRLLRLRTKADALLGIGKLAGTKKIFLQMELKNVSVCGLLPSMSSHGAEINEVGDASCLQLTCESSLGMGCTWSLETLSLPGNADNDA